VLKNQIGENICPAVLRADVFSDLVPSSPRESFLLVNSSKLNRNGVISIGDSCRGYTDPQISAWQGISDMR